MAIISRTSSFVVGVDLGQRQDHTAAAVIESADLVHDSRDPYTYEHRREALINLRHLERVRLGTPYPDIVCLIKDLVCRPAIAGRCTLVVDATGVGAPVVDLLKREKLGCGLIPVTITGGDHESSDGHAYRVPKRDLITGLQVLFESKNFHIAKNLRDTNAFLEEIAGMRASMNGRKDDLVLSLSLAWWWAKKRVPGVWGTRPLL